MTDVIVPIFDEACRSNTTHKGGVKKLSNAIAGNADKKAFVNSILVGFYDKILLCTKKDTSVDRVVNFFTTFTAEMAAEDDDTVFATIIEHMVLRSKAENKYVRARACETVATVFNKFGENASLSTTIWSLLRNSFLPLLRDKNIAVRTWAVKILKIVQNDADGAEDKEVTKEFLRLMSSDPSGDVRAAVVSVLTLRNATMPELMLRLEDVSAETRRAVITKLMDGVTLRHIQAAFRPRIVKLGLLDRDEKVASLTSQLIMKWFEQFQYDMCKMLALFDMYENQTEVQLVVNCVLLEMDCGPSYNAAVKERVFNSAMPSTKGLEVRRHSIQVFWVIARCEYAKKAWSPAVYDEMAEAIVPTMAAVTKQLARASKELAGQFTPDGVALFRWLLRLATLVDSGVESGSCSELVQICASLLFDVTLPDPLVDDVLDCWVRCQYSSKALENDSQLMEKIVGFCQTLEKQDPLSIAREGPDEESEEDSQRWANAAAQAINIRMLQLISWALRRGSGGRVVEGNEHFETMVPWIIDAITDPSVDRRCLGTRCLGLLALSDARFYCDHYDLLHQVLGNVEEDREVRAVVLQAMLDSLMVHNSNPDDSLAKQKSANMSTALLRIFASEDEVLVPLACEGVAKLLFTGISDDVRLCGCLLTRFFGREDDEGVAAGMAEEDELQAQSGRGRLQQVLSLFFHSFYLVDDSRARLISQAMPELIANFVYDMRVAAENNSSSSASVQKTCEKLIGFCEFIKRSSATGAATGADKGAAAAASAALDEVTADVHMSLFASVARELLKHEVTSLNLKQEKLVAKDMVRALASVCSSLDWVRSDRAVDVTKCLDAVLSMVSPLVDKASIKGLTSVRNTLVVKCAAAPAPAITQTAAGDDSEEAVALSPFFSVAYGLLELVNETLGLDSDSNEPYNWSSETTTAGPSTDGIDTTNIIATGAGRAKRATRGAAAKPAARGKAMVESDSDSEESNEEEEEDQECFVE